MAMTFRRPTPAARCGRRCYLPWQQRRSARLRAPRLATLGSRKPHRGPTSSRILSSKYRDGEAYLYYYGHRYYAPGIGRWLSRDDTGEQLPRLQQAARSARPVSGPGSEDALYCFVGNRPVDHVDPWGDFAVPVPAPPLIIAPIPPMIDWSARINTWTARNLRALEAKLQALCPPSGSVMLSPVLNPRQCCNAGGPMSCKEQATKFASDYMAHVKAVLLAEYREHGDIEGGWLGDLRRRTGGSPGLGGDGYYCMEWAEKAVDVFDLSLKPYWLNNKLCFRGAQVSKGDTFWWWYSNYHSWFMAYGPYETSPTYLATRNTVVVDPWWSGGEYVIPRGRAYVAERVEDRLFFLAPSP
jgi:RHS repeat-associated protein